jgi:Leucine-rich repeat (LRR) protein
MFKVLLFVLCLFAVVGCNKGKAKTVSNGVELNLSRQNLTELPEDISELTKLKRLYANENKISSLSEQFNNLEQLVELDLSYNQLTELPDGLAKAKNLELVHLSHNKLTVFPTVLLRLQNLQHLDLRDNNLTALPKEIGNLKKLEVIYLSGNTFTKEQRVEYRALMPKTKIVWSDGKTVVN